MADIMMESDKKSPGVHNIQVTCSLEKPLLQLIRRFVSNVAEDMGFDNEDVYKIEMSVDEACSNVILHAYDAEKKTETDCHVKLKLEMSEGWLSIEIEDQGKGTVNPKMDGAGDMETYIAPNKDSYHGLGLLIIREFMDEFQVDAVPDQGTRLLMRKFLQRTDEQG